MGRIWAIVSLAAAFAAGQAVAQPPQKTLSLTRMATSIRDGDEWGEVQVGLTCRTVQTLRWSGSGNRFEDSGFTLAFRHQMVQAGFRMTGGGDIDLFAPRQENADLQVGALVTSLRLTTCTPRSDGRGDTDGSASMEVQWQVFSPAEGKVVAKFRTSGSAGDERPSSEVVDAVLTKAFARNAEELSSDPAFIKLVRSVEVQQPSAPLAPLIIALAAGKPAPISEAGAGVVSIVLPSGHGSGVLISAEGYILTNHHVAGDGGKVRVIWPDGTESTGEVLRSDRRRDVALVKIAPSKVPPLAIRHTAVKVGETAYAIGTPMERELAGTLTRGVVSGMRTLNGQPFIQSDVTVTHGNSGGPLLDEKGQIVGLTVSGLESNGAPLGLNFFIPIDDALRALAIKPAA